MAKAIECKVNGVEKGIVLTENDLYLSQTEAVPKERFTAIRTMHQTVMQKFAQWLLEPVEKYCKTGSGVRTSGEILLRYYKDKLGICNRYHIG